ncbi:MAG TPA: cytochrome d ubiquinol oxidase subunit II [Syntrophales bacterium]|nr:cytochrome d ubiquinol oxidase subunit II [Syntrophales bacterium]HOM06387.1 cytochrome d ubiquinol oxidase subunit II [Syntrophales bacterium]HON99162.1 cytochrome d ubiquinol oxidase subunit II [Syntrophales bacterium]HPC00270.1 cytochrome d ubiquinol oxidase subunit II [Syntrophales bacterium]HPQ05933.1 cytochrome d ubiquinol oxidase subunit II [Syntrophales bacterium]
MELSNLWFVLWGLLWIAYFVTDGFDLGVGILYPFLGRTEAERGAIRAAIGPVWDGNEVWLVIAGAMTFAAFPVLYAALFSSLYAAFFILLGALILRGTALEFRGKGTGRLWGRLWDGAFFTGSGLCAFLFGVAFGNVWRGLPLGPGGYEGSFFSLLNVYGLTTGLLFVVVFAAHGALWLALRLEGEAGGRARRVALRLWIAGSLLVLVFLVNSALYTHLYANYLTSPALMVLPALALASLFLQGTMIVKGLYGRAFAASCLVVALIFATAMAGMYPHLLPSRTAPPWGLTIYNAAAGEYTLRVMAAVALTVLPVVAAYQCWVYRVFSRPIKEEKIREEEGY